MKAITLTKFHNSKSDALSIETNLKPEWPTTKINKFLKKLKLLLHKRTFTIN
jgi:hypothetical protein